MPGVAVLPPTLPGPGFGSSHSENSHLYLSDTPRSNHTHVPAMHNGPVSTNDKLSVAEVKDKAKEDVRKFARGVAAMSLIGSARSQSQMAQVYENQGDLKGALGALLKAGMLAHMVMNSSEFIAEQKPGKHGVLYREFFDFQKVRHYYLVMVVCSLSSDQREGNNLRQRVQIIESKLTDLEKLAAT
jgi:ubiquitin carboxyl-terminal hydrolase 8